ncbi:MAG: GDSL-type esterase/lipase family protein [Lentisphaerota bacterium]
MLKLLRILMSGFLVLTCFCIFASDEGKIIAVYGDAVSVKNPPPAWNFLWNANGKINDSKSCLPLVAVESVGQRRTSLTYGVQDKDGALRTDRPSHSGNGDVFSLRDKDGGPLYAIASYTLQEDSQGEVWINNGNMLCRFADETMLEIYLNDELKFSTPVKKDLLPLLFQKKMGRLKKGDSIRVAVGPGEKSSKGSGRLRFVIEEFQAGQKPGEPVNILSPALTAAEPQRSASGKYDAYLSKHKEQCDALLSNKSEMVFIGDSITARWPAELLNEKYGKYHPVNMGIGGDWIQNVLWRVQNGVLDQARIKVIVLLIGTNNLFNGFTPDDVAEGTACLIKTLRGKSPGSKILLLGILPCGDSIRDPKCEIRRQANAKTALLADNKTVFFLDIGDKLVEPDGTIRNDVMPDRLHVAMPGYIRWLNAMSPTLDTLLGTQ